MLIFALVSLFVITGCKDKKGNILLTVPQVTTAAIINVTFTTAVCGGTITDDGGGAVTASGICFSDNNPMPVLGNDTTKGTTRIGNFVSNLVNLHPGTTYYVRAYAINNYGVGYGNVVQFNTANSVPEARSITIAGDRQVAETIVARYTYFDAENDPKSEAGFKWYVANDNTGAGETLINNATDSTYTIKAADENKFLRVGITAKASAGTSPGIEMKSDWIGPVGPAQPTSVTFTYNGQLVTYGIIRSPVTGRKWLDRNLGAPAVPNSFDNWQNMGDLFQWGRKPDGHQLINRAATSNQTTGVNATTTNLSSTDNPGHSLFIINTSPTDPFDWRDPQNTNMWTESGGINNACPVGWHVPAKTEWEAENLGNVQNAFTQLKITMGGMRNYNNAAIAGVTITANYWTSTFPAVGTPKIAYEFYLTTNTAFAASGTSNANGFSVRCIKD